MDIIREYYGHEILLTRQDDGWSWVLSLSVGSYPVIIASSVTFQTPFLAEQTAIKGIKIFCACCAISGFLNECKDKGIISKKEHRLLSENISNCHFDDFDS